MFAFYYSCFWFIIDSLHGYYCVYKCPCSARCHVTKRTFCICSQLTSHTSTVCLFYFCDEKKLNIRTYNENLCILLMHKETQTHTFSTNSDYTSKFECISMYMRKLIYDVHIIREMQLKSYSKREKSLERFHGIPIQFKKKRERKSAGA